MSPRVDAYFQSKKNLENVELCQIFSELEEAYNKKLWHQVTKLLLNAVKNPELKKGTQLVDLYKNLISEIENRINPISLTILVGEVIKQIEDPNEAITFIEKLQPKVADHTEANVFCNVLIAQITLYSLKDQKRTKTLLEDTEKSLNSIDGITEVHGKFYKLLSELHCQTGSHAKYYRSALRYLGCTDISALDKESRTKQAFFLGLAALLGEGVYNFGELLSHSILDDLKSTEFEWMNDLLYAFNEGNIVKFEAMKAQWSTQPDLVAKEQELREKIRILCLMEMSFKRKANGRQLSFDEISKETQLPKDDIEIMVMSALAKELVKGKIDQVDEMVHITWVQPRVLDKNQLANMRQRLSEWCKDVSGMQSLLEDQAKPILTL